MGRSRSRERSRGRDGQKKKYRSRSEESADRSREREKRRRRQQREFMQKYGGKTKNTGKQSDGGGGIFWDGFQWIPVQDKAKAQDAATRKLRRLYLGNLPISLGLNEKTFMAELIKAMRGEGIVDQKKTELEIQKECNLWFAKDSNYGFMECGNVEDAEKIMLKLNGMLVMGQPIEIKRPQDNPGSTIGSGLAPTAPQAKPSVACNSRVLEISQALIYEQGKTDNEMFEETLEDMTDGCGQHGKINNGKIVRPHHADKIVSSGIQTMRVGNVYLEFVSVSDAAAAMAKMGNRKYDGRLLHFEPFPEDKFYSVIMNLK